MKIQTGGDCSAADHEQLVPPVGRRRKRILLGRWQTALQAVTLFVSMTSLMLSSIVFMVLLYTPASSTLGQARDLTDIRQVVDLQRQTIGRLQRDVTYMDARQKAFQSALAAAGLLTGDVRARLEGIERALMTKDQAEVPEDIAELVSIGAAEERSSLIGRPDGHERGDDELIGRHDGHERGDDELIGRHDGHERGDDELIGRHDGHERRDDELIGRHDGHERGDQELIGRHDGHERRDQELIGRHDGHEPPFMSAEESY